jgi:hypothetical protein
METLQTNFWRNIQSFMSSNPIHEHTWQWMMWIEQGLNQYSKVAFCNIKDRDTRPTFPRLPSTIAPNQNNEAETLATP